MARKVSPYHGSRMSMVEKLYRIGLNRQDMANALLCSVATVVTDMKSLPTEAQRSHPFRPNEKFRGVLRYWANLSHPLSEADEDIVQCFCRLPEIRKFERLISPLLEKTKKRRRPRVQVWQEGYVRFFEAVYCEDPFFASRIFGDLLFEYLRDLKSLELSFPDSTSVLLEGFTPWFIQTRTTSIRPWPTDGSIEQLIEIELDRIDHRRAALLRMKFDIASTIPSDQALQLNESQILEEEKLAISRLRELSHEAPVQRIVMTTIATWRDSANPEKSAQWLRVPPSKEKHLLMSLDQLPLSCRAADVYRICRIFFVGQLIQLQEEELMDYEGFGYISLVETKRALASFGLQLNLRLNDAQKQLIEDALQKLSP